MKVITHIFFALGLLISGCSEKIDFNLPTESSGKLVIEGRITDSTMVHKVKLSRITPYFDNSSITTESGATVSITDGSVVFNLTESGTTPGTYETAPTVKGEIGKTYTLNVLTSNGESYSASSELKRVPKIGISAKDTVSLFTQDPFIALFYWGKDPDGVGDHYFYRVYIDGALDNDSLSEMSREIADDELVDGITFVDEIYDFYYFGMDRFEKDTLTVQAEILSITEDEFDFIIGVKLETDWKGTIFDGPSANPKSNVSNGGFGYFGASAVRKSNLITIIRTPAAEKGKYDFTFDYNDPDFDFEAYAEELISNL